MPLPYEAIYASGRVNADVGSLTNRPPRGMSSCPDKLMLFAKASLEINIVAALTQETYSTNL